MGSEDDDQDWPAVSLVSGAAADEDAYGSGQAQVLAELGAAVDSAEAGAVEVVGAAVGSVAQSALAVSVTQVVMALPGGAVDEA